MYNHSKGEDENSNYIGEWNPRNQLSVKGRIQLVQADKYASVQAISPYAETNPLALILWRRNSSRLEVVAR